VFKKKEYMKKVTYLLINKSPYLSGDLIFRLGLLVPEPWAKSSTFTISDPTSGLMSSTTSSLSISTRRGTYFGQKIFKGEHFATKDIP
jgi:hypothetical protein